MCEESHHPFSPVVNTWSTLCRPVSINTGTQQTLAQPRLINEKKRLVQR